MLSERLRAVHRAFELQDLDQAGALKHAPMVGDERAAYLALAKHYEVAGLHGLAEYYREQAELAS